MGTLPQPRFSRNFALATWQRQPMALDFYLVMKTTNVLIVALAVSVFVSLSQAAEDSSEEIRNTSVVESGTYQVTAKKVDPEEREIYATIEDGRTLELYFSDATKLTQAGKDVGFDALKNGQKLEVQLEKDGNKLKPLAVIILE
jgi:CspA family cold shock protein